MTKNEIISAQIATLIASGMAPVAALRTVVGDKVVDQMIGDLYDALKGAA